ncbi:MAG TPA: S8 family serine peptidase, partial [Anaerolineales bacterium]|nr:S8 family serine peptidase [Anaerolineales bacterium]
MKKRSKSLIWISAGLLLVLVVLAYGGWNRMVMTRAKDPGLGVRRLHSQGITGKGISVAIIDGHIRTDHVEYRDQLAHYEELSDFEGIPYEAHGSSVASILVGKQIGVAPGAQLYYFA